MNRAHGLKTLIVAALVLVAGCGSPGPSKTAAPGGVDVKTRDTVGDKAPNEGGGITEQEALAFAQQIEKTMSAGDPSFFNSSMDFQTIGHSVTDGLGLSPRDRQDAISGFAKAGNEFGKIVVSSLEGGRYVLLRVRTVDGMPRPIFRLLASNGLNYQELRLRKDKGKVRIVDLYIYTAGELYTEMLRRFMAPVVAQVNPGLLDSLLGTKSNGQAALDTVMAMQQQLKSGQYPQAIASYKRLPPELKKDKALLLSRMQAASQVDTNEYQVAMEDIKRHYPNEPGLRLVFLDYYFLKKDMDNVLKLIDELDQSVGGDPYLNVFRGNALIQQAKFDQAEKLLSGAIAAGPDMYQFHAVMMEIYMKQKKYAKVVEEINLVGEKFQIAFPALEENAEYAEFIASPEYREYKRKQNQAEPDGAGDPLTE